MRVRRIYTYVREHRGPNKLRSKRVIRKLMTLSDGVLLLAGDYAAVGADNEDTSGSNAGSVYIFKRSGTSWSQQQKIQSSDIQADDYFGGGAGQGVSLSGDTLAVGARKEDTGGSEAGSVYIFKRSSTYVFTGTSPSTITLGGFWYTNFSRWYQKSTSDATSSYVRYILWDSSGQVGANYGTSFTVNSSGDLILDVNDSTGGSNTPQYFVNNTTSTTVSSGTGTVSVGDSIELFVGSPGSSEATFTVPSVFAPTSGDVWSQQQKIQASDVSADSQFGMSVSLSGDVLAVSADQEDTIGTDAGAAYIFERSGTTWTEVKRITASDGQANDYFGESISTDGTTTFVGAFAEDTKGSNAGAVYVYEKQYVGPTLTYDNSNKLSLTGVSTSASTNLTFGSIKTGIGAAKDVYITDQGTYKFHTNDGDQSLLTE